MKIFRILLLVLALVTASTAAAAQSACAPRAVLLEQLAALYGEAPVAAGLTASALLMEVLASADGASWTIIATSPDGLSCLIAAGEGWRDVAPAPPGPRA